ncbi:conserved hypothetical protein [Anaeromyxobacter dehalogenans 2CP-1]|uniref:Uncharacterized protein n=1 Tax=Anaeromyxobacter dehalogenans (strain ATCC BAA-258 / DSM 21875 / 2CP-1) TaxID=455488 RepID=B8JCQ6_ANAD2|nr:conserved hypothetical protein [Anaeromyxobacter dehalogenans 2CP-1]
MNLRTQAAPGAPGGLPPGARRVTSGGAVALLDALRALTSFSPPAVLPDCEPGLLGDVLVAHGLAPLASFQLEHTRLGASAPEGLRERLLAQYQGVANDNVLKMVTLRGLLRPADGVPVVLLDAAAYIDWLYPHLAFRPVGDLRVALAAGDAQRFADAIRGGMQLERTEHGGRTAIFGDGRLTVAAQEGLFSGAPADPLLFQRSTPYLAFGAAAARPSAEDALLGTVGEQALLGLRAPLITYVDVRELLRLGLDREYVLARARALGLARALHGVSRLAALFFPDVADAAAAVRPELGAAERLAVERVVEAASDPARLRQLRGEDAAARLVVAP